MQNKKPVAETTGRTDYLKHRLTMKHCKLKSNLFQFNSAKKPIHTTSESVSQNSARLPFRFAALRLVCDECAVPLHLYGENFIESYKDGKANMLRCLCDLHADELEVSK